MPGSFPLGWNISHTLLSCSPWVPGFRGVFSEPRGSGRGMEHHTLRFLRKIQFHKPVWARGLSECCSNTNGLTDMAGVTNLKNPLATPSLLGEKFLLASFSSTASITPFYLKAKKQNASFYLAPPPLLVYTFRPGGGLGCGSIFQRKTMLPLSRGQANVNVSALLSVNLKDIK